MSSHTLLGEVIWGGGGGGVMVGHSQYRISCVKMVCGGVQSVRRVLGVDCGGGEEGVRRG